VGSFEKGISNLKKYNLTEILNEEIIIKKKEILGICLGFQLMCKKVKNSAYIKGSDWLDLKVTKIKNIKLRLPHVGWNKIKINHSNSNFFKNIENQNMFYFNHSYAVRNSNTYKFSDLMTCDYGENFIAALKV
jgi:glutamine amidotransferase